jgi:hypothetical protein
MPAGRNEAGVKRGPASFAAPQQKLAKRVRPPQGVRAEVMNAHTLYPSLFLFPLFIFHNCAKQCKFTHQIILSTSRAIGSKMKIACDRE